MAGGPHQKPPPSSSDNRKSRWESSASAAAKNPNNKNKSTDHSKPSKPSNPSPKPARPSPKTATAASAVSTEPIATPPGMGRGRVSGPAQFPFPDLGPIPQPSYGFHMLDRRTIALADGSVRSYFALPPDYQDFLPRFMPPPGAIGIDGGGGPRFPPMSPEGLGMGLHHHHHHPMKRKFEDPVDFRGAGTSSPFGRGMGGGNEFVRAGKLMRVDGVVHKHLGVDPTLFKKAFLHFVKVINESEGERKRYLEDGKRLRCIACGRSSKDFSDMHALIMHTYNSDNADLHVDHLGLHKALCILMGWNYAMPPDNSKAYQFLPADEAIANQEDLIVWPPIVIIQNTITGKGKEGRMEGLGNKAMDARIRDLGISGGKSKSLYGRDGHQGVTLIKFNGDASGLNEGIRLAEHFERENHGRRAWMHLQPVTLGKDDDRNPALVKTDRNGEKNRILYGYLAIAADLHKIDFDTRKKLTVESRREYRAPN